MNQTHEIMASYESVCLKSPSKSKSNSPNSKSTFNISSYIDNIKDFIGSNINSDSSFYGFSSESSDTDDANDNNHFNMLCKMRSEIKKLKNNNLRTQKSLEKKIRYVTEVNKELNEEIIKLYDYIQEIDTRVIDLEQYTRRHNIIITGISDTIRHENLEIKVIEILRTIGININHYDILACHRLYRHPNSRYPAKTIIRFLNRKIVDFCLENRNRLVECKQILKMNLRFYENLCNANETVLRWCKDLKFNNVIHDFFIRNGFMKIIVDAGDKPIKIRHPDSLYNKFQEFFEEM